MPDIVEIEGGRSPHAAAQPALEVLTDSTRVGVRIQLATDPRAVKAEILRVLQEVVFLERVLVLEEGRVHLEESPLDGRGFGDFGGLLRMRVRSAEREVAENIAELVAKQLLELLHDRHGCAAVRTLVVAVLDEGHRRGRRPLDMVTLPHRQSEPRDTTFRHVLPPDETPRTSTLVGTS